MVRSLFWAIYFILRSLVMKHETNVQMAITCTNKTGFISSNRWYFSKECICTNARKVISYLTVAEFILPGLSLASGNSWNTSSALSLSAAKTTTAWCSTCWPHAPICPDWTRLNKKETSYIVWSMQITIHPTIELHRCVLTLSPTHWVIPVPIQILVESLMPDPHVWLHGRHGPHSS